eukprot:6848527-Pyramimonas_sp.AAC.1
MPWSVWVTLVLKCLLLEGVVVLIYAGCARVCVCVCGAWQLEERLSLTEAELETTLTAKTDLEDSLAKVTESLTELYMEREADQEEARWQANVDAHVHEFDFIVCGSGCEGLRVGCEVDEVGDRINSCTQADLKIEVIAGLVHAEPPVPTTTPHIGMPMRTNNHRRAFPVTDANFL